MQKKGSLDRIRAKYPGYYQKNAINSMDENINKLFKLL